MPDINTTGFSNTSFNPQLTCPGDKFCMPEEAVKTIERQLEDINRKLALIDTAFLRDDLSATDYPGHRKDHLDRRKSETIITEYKISGTKVILGAVITFILGILGSGVFTKLASIVATGGT